MSELENLVYKNGRWFDKRTNNRVFLKQPKTNDKPLSDTITQVVEENLTEASTEPPKAIRKPPVKRVTKPKV